ncbi:unnamed protein product [Closterium sp. NIES-54]
MVSEQALGTSAPWPLGPRPLAPLILTIPANATTATATTTTAATTVASAAPACCTAMASLRVLAFDHKGRPVQFVQCLCVARYSSPATAALGRLLLPYLFPALSIIATVEDLVSHLRASDARYRVADPTEFLDRNQPPMFITLYFIVARLPDSLRSVRDHFLSLDPTSLTVDLLEQHLLAAETSAVAVGAARGTPRPPFFEGCSPSPLAPSYASSAAADVSVAEDIGAASASAKRRSGKGKGGKGGGGGSGGGGGGSGSSGGGSSGGGGGSGTGGGSGGSSGGGGGSGGSGGGGGSGSGGGGNGARRVGCGGGQRQQQQRRSETQSPQQLLRLQLRERFGQDLPVLRLHSDRGGEFSSNLLRDFCHGEGILQSFTLLDSPQQNGIEECRIGLVIEVARTSMIHAAAPHFLWPFAVGNASVFRVWGSRAFVRDSSADKLCPCVIPCIFLGFVPDAPGWQFYLPTWRRVFPSQDVTFDEPIPFYHLFPYRSAPLPPPLLFLAPNPPPVNPLPPQGPAPSGVSQVDPLPGPAPVQVAVGSNAARGTASGGAASGSVGPGGAASWGAVPGGAESEGAKTGGAEPWGVALGGGEPRGAEPEGVEPGGATSEGAESVGAEPQGAASSGVSDGASLRLSPPQLQEWFVRRARLRTRAAGAGVATGAGVPGGTAVTGPGGARTWGTGAAGTGGVEGAEARDPTESGATCANCCGTGGAGAGGAGVGGAGAGGTEVGGPGVGGAGAGGAGAIDPGGAVRPRPYFVPLLQHVLGTPSSTPLLCPPPDQSRPPLQPASPMPAPSPYSEQSGGLTERCEPASRPVSPVPTARRVPRPCPPVPGTHAMTLCPSSIPLRVPLPTPPESSLREVPDPESDRARAASPTVSRLLATAVTDPSIESAVASALVAKLLDFATVYHLDYATALVAESASASPPSVGGEFALSTDVLEDRQEDFECLAAAVPRFASILLAPDGDPDAVDIPTPRSYAEAITGPYSSQ